jgi:glycosyltransferase involved in cell wall biosynthesis
MISTIICTLNEEAAIGSVLDTTPRTVCGEENEILVVDGGSSDATIDIVERREDVRLLVERRKGKGVAMRTGVAAARGAIMVFQDGDGTHLGIDIPRFVQAITADGYDLSIGNVIPHLKTIRWRQLIPFTHSFGFFASRCCYYLKAVREYYRRPRYWDVIKTLQDPLNGHRAIRKSDFNNLNLRSTGFELETEMNCKAIEHGLSIIHIPIAYVDRRGESKLLRNPGAYVKIVRTLFADHAFQ